MSSNSGADLPNSRPLVSALQIFTPKRDLSSTDRQCCTQVRKSPLSFQIVFRLLIYCGNTTPVNKYWSVVYDLVTDANNREVIQSLEGTYLGWFMHQTSYLARPDSLVFRSTVQSLDLTSTMTRLGF